MGKYRSMEKYSMQLIFGVPILAFTLVLITVDAFGLADIGKFGYAFFGGVISHFMTYFFRKAPPNNIPPEGTPTP